MNYMSFRFSILAFLLMSIFKTANAAGLLDISKLPQSITMVKPGMSTTLRVIEKTWSETFDGNRRFDLKFYGVFDENQSNKKYWQSIPVYDGDKELNIKEWNSADCSLQQAIIRIYDRATVYLIVSERLEDTQSAEIQPQNEPAKQRVMVFQLDRNENKQPGRPRAFFSKLREQTSADSVCTSTEVSNILNNTLP